MAGIFPLKENESAFKEAKQLLCSNVTVLQERCFNIKGDALFVQEINEKVQELMDSLDLVQRASPKKMESRALLLMKACFKEK